LGAGELTPPKTRPTASKQKGHGWTFFVYRTGVLEEKPAEFDETRERLGRRRVSADRPEDRHEAIRVKPTLFASDYKRPCGTSINLIGKTQKRSRVVDSRSSLLHLMAKALRFCLQKPFL
jgi:hypothetical protein